MQITAARNVHAAARALLLGLGCLSVLLLGACNRGGDADSQRVEKPKPTPLARIDAEVRVKRLWSASVGRGVGRKFIALRPAILADRVYAADAYGLVAAFDRFKGKRLWQVRIGDPDGNGARFWDRRDPAFVSGGTGAGGGLVFIGTTAGDVIALDAGDGSEFWRIQVGTEVVAPPVFDDGRLFVQTIDGRLLARDAEDGSAIWAFDIPVPILTLRGTATPVVEDEIVYTGFANGMLVALNARNGERLWQHRVRLPQGRSELQRMADVDASPLVDGPLIYAISHNGNIVGVRRQDGRPLWQREYASHKDLATGYSQLYLVDERDEVVALDTQTAEDAWTQEGLVNRKLSAPLAFSNYLLIGDDQGYLHVLAQSDGRFIGRVKLGSGLRSNLVENDGVVYAYGNGGSLIALEIEERDT
ncbi:MAG: outer membrane protein assembly factor BamB [Pseudomonadota bacterium]